LEKKLNAPSSESELVKCTIRGWVNCIVFEDFP
jgi:hypothetical protein